jgi:hypothetical protein
MLLGPTQKIMVCTTWIYKEKEGLIDQVLVKETVTKEKDKPTLVI